MQKSDDVKIVRDAGSGQCSGKKDNISEKVYGAAWNWSVAEVKIESEICS